MGETIIEKLDTILFSLQWPLTPLSILFFMLILALITLKTHALTLSGAFGAVVLGFCVTLSLRIEGFLVFLCFFVFSQISGKVSKKRRFPVEIIEEKSGARDIQQVFANGFMASVGALWWYFSSSTQALVVFATSVSEAFADTLSSDIGKLSVQKPVSILNGFPLKKGESGGITALGVFAGFSGSAIISILWMVLFNLTEFPVLTGLVCICGFAGCLVDSFLGASLQAIYKDKGGNRTEKAFDKDGNENTLIRGIKIMNNDLVNFISNVFAVILASSLYLIFE